MNVVAYEIRFAKTLEFTGTTLCDLPAERMWAALSAHQAQIAQTEPDSGSDAPSAAVLDALFGDLRRAVLPAIPRWSDRHART